MVTIPGVRCLRGINCAVNIDGKQALGKFLTVWIDSYISDRVVKQSLPPLRSPPARTLSNPIAPV